MLNGFIFTMYQLYLIRRYYFYKLLKGYLDKDLKMLVKIVLTLMILFTKSDFLQFGFLWHWWEPSVRGSFGQKR